MSLKASLSHSRRTATAMRMLSLPLLPLFHYATFFISSAPLFMNFPFLYRHSAWRAFLKLRDGKHCRRRRMKMKFHHYNSTSFAIFFPQISFRRKFFLLQIGFLSLTPAYLRVSPANKINRWGIVSSLSDVTQIF